jgi:hypothetical protein
MVSPDFKEDDMSGSLPHYAQHADRAKLVKILCKGQCNGVVRFAELNKPYPGQAMLRDAEMGIYEAICLKCGKIAIDHYNWFRP